MLVVGDVMLDRYLWGTARRLSPEAPVPVLRSNRHEARLGGAAAVAYLLRGLAAKVTLCGIIGDDADGRTLRALLGESAIDHSLILEEVNRLTTTKERFVGQLGNRCPHQMLRVDREAARRISVESTSHLLAGIRERLPDHDVLL
ncbi:MAG: bifunctional heptose 7-phosphate kinase/heptose 1-phosphate adenyltransferase, partial [Pirellulales bacterium]